MQRERKEFLRVTSQQKRNKMGGVSFPTVPVLDFPCRIDFFAEVFRERRQIGYMSYTISQGHGKHMKLSLIINLILLSFLFCNSQRVQS